MDIESFFEFIKGKKVALCGVGRTHIPLAGLFIDKGARISIRDKRSMEQLGEDGLNLQKLGAEMILGESYLNDLDEDIIFRTPGMKFTLPELEDARRRGKIVTSEMEVFLEICPCKIYAVTGSDGKTTTTTIISEFLKASGYTVHLGGNIGNALLPEIEKIDRKDAAVVELSSFQLMSMRNAPDVSVVTNLSPNHLDWHKDMDEYTNAKKNIFLHQNAFSRTVLNADNEITASFAGEVRGDLRRFSIKEQIKRGAFYKDGEIFLNGEKLLDASDIRIKGMHNVENYLAAICAVSGDVDKDSIKKVAENFQGTEHRMEFVGELDGVKYYNDSIATSPSRTISGTLSLYDEKIILICGGYDKNVPFDSLGPVICDKVKVLILMGDTAPKIEKSVKEAHNYKPEDIKIERVQNMAEAVLLARNNAEPGDIVSLSPASAGFDMYANFEERGRHFKHLVKLLK